MAPTTPDLELVLSTPFRLIVQAVGPWGDEAVTGFTFEVATLSDFSATLASEAVAEAAYQFAIGELNRADTLYVRAKATNGDGDSAWAAALTVAAVAPPATPTLEVRGSAPQRIAAAIPAPDPAASVVEFEFSRDPAFDPVDQVLEVSAGPAVAEYRVPDVDRDVAHYVRARIGVIADFDETTELLWYSAWSATLEVPGAGKVGNPDIRTGAVNDFHIEPERIVASSITPVLELQTNGGLRAIQSGPAGVGQVVFDPQGVRVLDADGAVKAALPAAGPPVLTGATIAAASLSSEQSTFAGATNLVAGGTVTVGAGVAPAPTAAPTLDQTYAASYTWSDAALSHWCLVRDGSYYWAIAYGGAQDGIRRYTLVGNVLTWDGSEWAPTGWTLHSFAKVGSYLYAIGDDGAGNHRFLVRSAPSGSRTTTVSASRTEIFNAWEPALLTDGVRLFAIDTPAGGSAQTALRIRQYNVSGTTLPAATGTARSMELPAGVATATSPESTLALTGVLLATSSPADAWLSISDGTVERVYRWTITYTAAGVSSDPTLGTGTDSGWALIGGGAPYGLTSTVAMTGAHDAVALGWADAFAIQVAHLWANASTGRTAISPASATLQKVYGTNVRVVAGYPPTGATRAFVYADVGSGYAERKIVAASSGQVAVATITSADAAGGAIPAEVSFAGGSSAVIQSASPGWALYGDGTMSGIASVPTGAVTAFAGSAAPAGWLLCDGSAVSQATYASLYAVLGSTYNTGGEGAGNFRLPDLRQRFVLGRAASGTGSALGASGGAIDHGHAFTGSSATSSTASSHDHAILDGNDATRLAATNQDSSTLVSRGAHDHYGATQSAGSHSHTLTASGSNATGNPPYLVLNHIIRT